MDVHAKISRPQSVQVRHALPIASAGKVREKIEDLGIAVIEYETNLEQLQHDRSLQTPTLSMASTAHLSPGATPKILKTTFDISGMTCASCVATLSGILKAIDGVKQEPEVAVTLLPHQRAVVYHDPSIVSAETIAKRIDDAGFDVLEHNSVLSQSNQSPANPIRLRMDEEAGSICTLDGASPPPLPPKETLSTASKFRVNGMTCSGCAVKIEEALLRKGVISASVSFVTGLAVVVYDPSRIGIREILSCFTYLGYTAELEKSTPRARYKEIHRKELIRLLIETIIGLAFVIPTIVISMIIGMALPMENSTRMLLFGPMESIPGLSLGVILLFILATIVQFGLGWRFYAGSYKAIVKTRAANMDVLIALGTTAAYFYSVALTLSGIVTRNPRQEQFFETSILLIFFVILGRLLESYAKRRTNDAVESLVKLTPSTAFLVIHEGEREISIAGEREIIGDILKVPMGSRFPADGFLVRGTTSVDESMLTGESIPIEKQPGDEVIGGSLNVSSVVLMKVFKVGDGTLTEGKATVTASFQETAFEDIFETPLLWAAIFDLVSSSSHPLSKAIQGFIIETRGEQIDKNYEKLPPTNLKEMPGLGLQGDFCLDRDRWIRLLVGNRKWMEANALNLDPPNAVRDKVEAWEEKGNTCVYVGLIQMKPTEGSAHEASNFNLMPIGGSAIAAFAIADDVRPSSKQTVAKLRAAGIDVHMVTGDSPRTALAVARRIGIPPANVWAGLRPEEKAERVKGLKVQAGLRAKISFASRFHLREEGCVAFVGDGVNDAIALLAADVG
ncbi:hypothetical protein HDU96_010228 [Phlyctochytrium bullatum]|nr:hypothetical protein HDU96_010228 [Phlyctochytrium bullatum]